MGARVWEHRIPSSLLPFVLQPGPVGEEFCRYATCRSHTGDGSWQEQDLFVLQALFLKECEDPLQKECVSTGLKGDDAKQTLSLEHISRWEEEAGP